MSEGPLRQRPIGPLPEWPYRFEVVVPARWPSRDEAKRARLALPLRGLARLVHRLGNRIGLVALAVEGRPLGRVVECEGWSQRHVNGGWRWVYSGPVTPAIRAMYAEHPERFEHSAPALLYTLRCGQ